MPTITETHSAKAPFATRSEPERRSISKTRHMYYRQCAKRAWWMEHEPIEHTPPPFGSIIWQGIEAGIMARSLVPGGKLIDADYRDYQTVLDLTAELMADPTVPAIFEAGFAHSRVLIRADILERRNGKWVLGEVKSSTHCKEEHLVEIALQVYILIMCGVELDDVELILIDNEYVRQDELDVFGLFQRVSVANDILPLMPNVRSHIEANLEVLALPSAPDVRPSRHCHKPYECDFWKRRCTVDKPADWIYRIPRINRENFAVLDNAGIESMRDIPARFRLSPTQARVVSAAKTGQVWRSPSLPYVLKRLLPPGPVSYLDFETMMPGIPIYPGTSPYQRIAAQWSLHHDSGSDNLIHFEFLARRPADPRRKFVETLLSAAESLRGPIAVWSSYEASVIRELGRTYPALASRLEALVGRLVDLLPVVRDHIAHPGFAGSYSLKAVAPVLAPNVSYAGLDIADGDDASAAIYRLASDPSLKKHKRSKLRRALLAYCGRDTLALVHVHRWLAEQHE